MDSISNNKSTVFIGLAAAAAVILYVALSSSSKKMMRRAKMVCTCGIVEAELYMPSANYKYAEPACFQCGCHNCVGFIDKVLESGPSKSIKDTICTPGAPNLIMYDSEILVTKGQDYIQSMKLSKKTENRRIYTKCCGTPLGISDDRVGINMIVPNLIKKTTALLEPNEIDFPNLPLEPTVCLYADNTKAAGKTISPQSMKLIPSTFAPGFIGLCLYRVALLAAVGGRGPGKGFPTNGQVEIGIETITSGQ